MTVSMFKNACGKFHFGYSVECDVTKILSVPSKSYHVVISR